MVVDDSEVNVALLSDILVEEGYRVQTATDGELALHNIRLEPPAIILLDIRMPGIDGYEVCRSLKEDEKTRSIPVIFISGLGEESDKVKAFQVGGVDYLTKPFQVEEVLARVNTHLTLARVKQDLELRNIELEAKNIELAKEVAERKRSEEALRTTLQRFYTILSSLYAGVLIMTEDNRVEFANQAFCDLFDLADAPDGLHGLTGPDILKKIRDVYAEPEEILARISEVVATQVSVRVHEVAIRGGRTYVVDSVPIRVNSEPCGRLWHHIDITKLKKGEEERAALLTQLAQAQKMEAIGTLTGGIAHDFNNLLTIINGYTELILSEQTQDDACVSDLQKILETGRKGTELVQRMLALSRKGESDPQPMDINSSVEDAVALMRRTFPKMIQIQTSLEKDLSTVYADAVQVQQALMNLGINAKEAMPEGGRLAIETLNTEVNEDYCRLQHGAKPGRHVLIEISDSGTGMRKEIRDRIFDPFFTTKGWDFRKGTGLGLSVAKGIVEQHGGWITCQSALGEGTKFSVYFPAMKGSAAIRNLEPLAESVRAAKKILLIDDEAFVSDLGKRILERAGYNVITAGNGYEALKIYAEEQSNIALVVLDLIMPLMSGEKCLEELFKLNPHVKVVISSGHSLAPEERDRLDAHAKGFVNKPYEIEQLLEVAKRVLNAE